LAATALTRQITFLHDGLNPIDPGTLQALELAKQLDINFELVRIKSLINPESLKASGNTLALMTWPLDRLEAADPGSYKIVAILTDSYRGPCAPKGLDLKSHRLKISVQDYLGFYFPDKTIQSENQNMAQALSDLMKEPSVIEQAEKNCLVLAQLDPKTAPGFLLQQYQAQSELLAELKPGDDLDRPQS
jgi:hypothetical protein